MDEDSEPRGYSRQETIHEFLQILWTINVLPLFVSLFFSTTIMMVVTFPVSVIVWFVAGDRPVHRMPPTNFFFLLFWGSYSNARVDSEWRSTQIIFHVFSDFRMVGDDPNPYANLFRRIRGAVHPVLGFPYPMAARLLGMVLYGLTLWPFISIGWMLISLSWS